MTRLKRPELLYEKLLIERAKSGDERAAELVVRHFYPPILRFLRHLTWNDDDAEDLAQQTFLQAAKGLPRFRFGSSFNHWLHSIAYREYLRWLGGRKEVSSLEAADCVLASDSALAELIVLADVINGLAGGLRETFLLHEVQGLSVRETAHVLGIPAGTVKSRLARARELLQRRLDSGGALIAETRLEESSETA